MKEPQQGNELDRTGQDRTGSFFNSCDRFFFNSDQEAGGRECGLETEINFFTPTNECVAVLSSHHSCFILNSLDFFVTDTVLP